MTGTHQYTRSIGIILLGVIMLIVSGCSGEDGSGIDGLAAANTCSKNTNCPVAAAGPDQTVLVGTVATPDGSQSHSKTAGLISYQWTLSTKPTGSAAPLVGATTVRPTFTPDLAGSYSLSLVVSDGGVSSNPDSVTVTAGTGNLAPIADAGPDRTVLTGAVVALNGAAVTIRTARRSPMPGPSSASQRRAVRFCSTARAPPPPSRRMWPGPTDCCSR